MEPNIDLYKKRLTEIRGMLGNMSYTPQEAALLRELLVTMKSYLKINLLNQMIQDSPETERLIGSIDAKIATYEEELKKVRLAVQAEPYSVQLVYRATALKKQIDSLNNTKEALKNIDIINYLGLSNLPSLPNLPVSATLIGDCGAILTLGKTRNFDCIGGPLFTIDKNMTPRNMGYTVNKEVLNATYSVINDPTLFSETRASGQKGTPFEQYIEIEFEKRRYQASLEQDKKDLAFYDEVDSNIEPANIYYARQYSLSVEHQSEREKSIIAEKARLEAEIRRAERGLGKLFKRKTLEHLRNQLATYEKAVSEIVEKEEIASKSRSSLSDSIIGAIEGITHFDKRPSSDVQANYLKAAVFDYTNKEPSNHATAKSLREQLEGKIAQTNRNIAYAEGNQQTLLGKMSEEARNLLTNHFQECVNVYNIKYGHEVSGIEQNLALYILKALVDSTQITTTLEDGKEIDSSLIDNETTVRAWLDKVIEIQNKKLNSYPKPEETGTYSNPDDSSKAR